MNRHWKRAVVGVAVVTAALLASTPSGAAAPAQAQAAGKFCLVQPGKATQCTSTEAAMRMLAPTASHLLNLWENPNYGGFRLEIWRVAEPNGECSTESNFDPPDESFPIPLLNGQRWVSSVRKIDSGHCNWVLVGPNGARSTEVENDWPRLSNLGNGWDDRAVRVLVD
jgi:hypothetical protein